MPESTYSYKLAERALSAVVDDKPSLRAAVANILSDSPQFKDTNAVAKIRAMSRDDIQEAIVSALSPPPDFESTPVDLRVKIVAVFVSRIGCIPNAEWVSSVSRLAKTFGARIDALGATASDWQKFILPTPTEDSSKIPGSTVEVGDDALPQAGNASRLRAVADLIDSFAPVLARRTAAELTEQARVKNVFSDYGYKAD
jgi:hypothetical protein